MPDFKWDVVLGTVEPKVVRKFENGKMVSYCFSIHRDYAGVETHRTELTQLGSIGYDNGVDFTESDYNKITALATAEKKKGFWANLFGA